MIETLTANEQRVLDAIHAHFEQHNRMPTHAELAEALGLKSKNSSWQYLQQLQRKGYVHIDAYKQRGVMVSVPIVGHVACGTPVELPTAVTEMLEARHPSPAGPAP